MKKYPIAEIFTSPQGEGAYAGTLMTFIRIAGCSVGKKMTDEERAAFSRLENTALPVYREKCTLWDGRTFACDTNFQTKEVLSVDEILSHVPEGVEHICITGGEPLNHDLTELLNVAARDKGLDCHIETSGTVHIQKAYPDFDEDDLIGQGVDGWLWLTVSPKWNCLAEMISLASEVKLLVDGEFDDKNVSAVMNWKCLVYIQPVNYEHAINHGNVKRCLDLQHKHPHWRISNQSHKEWGVR